MKEEGFFEGEINGIFGPETSSAVFLFQHTYTVVSSLDSRGAGVWGPQTRKVANRIYDERDEELEVVPTPEPNISPIEEAKSPFEQTSIVSQPKDIGDIEKAFLRQPEENTVLVNDSVSNPSIIPSLHFFTTSLQRGVSGQSREEVRHMQQFLQMNGFYKGSLSGKFSAVTQRAVLGFQLAHGVVESTESEGAGVWGPKTRLVANGE